MVFQGTINSLFKLVVLAFVLLISPSYLFADQDSKSWQDLDKNQAWNDETYYEEKSSDFYDDKADYEYKHHYDDDGSKHNHEKRWSDYVKEARSHFRTRLRDLFQYLRRVRAALKDPDTDWDNFDWSYWGDKDESQTEDDSSNDSSNDGDTSDDNTSDGDDASDDDTFDEGDASDDNTSDEGDASDDNTSDEGDASDDNTSDDSDASDDSSSEDTVDDSTGEDISLIQSITVANEPMGLLNNNVEFEIAYSSSDNDDELSGLGLRIHFDSRALTYISSSDVVAQDIIVSGEGPAIDAADFDNDPTTDCYVSYGWASLLNNWPGTELPASLLKITFGVNGSVNVDDMPSTVLSFSAITTTVGYDFVGESYVLELAETDASWDFDGSGEADALTDGLIMLRYSFGLRGESMAEGAMHPESVMSAEQVEQRMVSASKIADIDNDGQIDALTDGLLLLRHLFAVGDEGLTHGAVGSKASRKTGTAIRGHLKKYMPKRWKERHKE